MDFIAQHGMTFEQAAAARQHDGGDHNLRETPLFAESIARRSLGPVLVRPAGVGPLSLDPRPIMPNNSRGDISNYRKIGKVYEAFLAKLHTKT
jgi:hypothetical protein